MVSGVFVAILGLAYIKITLAVVEQRVKQGITLGDGGSLSMQQIIAAHSNYQNYVPIFLVSLLTLEQVYAAPWYVVAVLGTFFCAGRMLHYLAFVGEMNMPNRKRGMVLTLFSLMGSSGLCLLFAVMSFF